MYLITKYFSFSNQKEKASIWRRISVRPTYRTQMIHFELTRNLYYLSMTYKGNCES